MRIHRSSSTPAALLAANDNGRLGAATSTPATSFPSAANDLSSPRGGELTLAAANDNPGGATSASLVLTGLASVIARAYVAQILKDAK